MKSKFYCTYLAALLAALLMSGCHPPAAVESKSTDEKEKTEKADAPGLKIEDEVQKKIGLTSEPLAAMKRLPEVQAYGQVLDPAPLAALLAEYQPAEVAAEASRQEWERLQKLYAQDNASTRGLQAAEAAAKRDMLALQSIQARLVLGWGKAIASRQDLPSLIHSLASAESVLVRLDLPAGESLKTTPAEVRLAGLGDGTESFTGTFVSEAPNVDPQSQGRGFLFLVKESRLKPGAALTGWLRNGDEPQAGVVIPRSAVVRAEGKAWVYVVSGAERFVRREVAVDQPTESGWFVASDFAAGEKVITVGAAQLLSEELKSRIQGGD